MVKTSEVENKKIAPFKFDREAIKKKMLEADALITNLNRYLPDYLLKEPVKHDEKDEAQEDDEIKEEEVEESGDEPIEAEHEENDTPNISRKSRKKKIEKLSKFQTVEELQQKLEEFKGKRKSYEMKLLQKAIKNKINKKKKAEMKREKKMEKLKKIGTPPGEPKVHSAKSNTTDEGNMMFSKLDFTFSDSVQETKKSIKDPKRALEILEKNKSKVQEMERTGRRDKAAALKTRQSWMNTLQKAEGVKIKDDIDLIKKSIKKKEHKKNKSKQLWEERNKQVEMKKGEKQKKRKENIAAKNKQKKQIKMKRAIKKGRIIQ